MTTYSFCDRVANGNGGSRRRGWCITNMHGLRAIYKTIFAGGLTPANWATRSQYNSAPCFLDSSAYLSARRNSRDQAES